MACPLFLPVSCKESTVGLLLELCASEVTGRGVQSRALGCLPILPYRGRTYSGSSTGLPISDRVIWQLQGFSSSGTFLEPTSRC